MPGDVFISYAREDKAFVRRLHQALATQGRDAWVDWEDIPLSADWWREICVGIEGANAFVFVISPDSARSVTCFKEIDYATEHHKRIMPVLRREITDEADEKRLHPTVNAHNWIFIREEDDFDTAFAALIEALDTDLAYTREHTRLLVRARNWEDRQHDRSLLLSGNALKEAEVWLAQGIAKERNKPTALHIEYIARSRHAHRRRQQRNAIITAVVSVIVALLVLSLILFVRAEDARQQADANAEEAVQARLAAENARNKSQAIGLAAQAQLELFGAYPERGVLLALEALDRLPYAWQADRALGTAVQASRARRILAAHSGAVLRAAFSPDGAQIATASADNSVALWEAASSPQTAGWAHGVRLQRRLVARRCAPRHGQLGSHRPCLGRRDRQPAARSGGAHRLGD